MSMVFHNLKKQTKKNMSSLGFNLRLTVLVCCCKVIRPRSSYQYITKKRQSQMIVICFCKKNGSDFLKQAINVSWCLVGSECQCLFSSQLVRTCPLSPPSQGPSLLAHSLQVLQVFVFMPDVNLMCPTSCKKTLLQHLKACVFDMECDITIKEACQVASWVNQGH